MRNSIVIIPVLLLAVIYFTFSKSKEVSSINKKALVQKDTAELEHIIDELPFYCITNESPQFQIEDTLNYNIRKNELINFKIKAIKDSLSLQEINTALVTKLVNHIFPHWYGTPWDFEGHTNIPNQGEVACGYFVSTTLKHIGFNINRYKCAQQHSLAIVKGFCGDIKPINYNGKKLEEWLPILEQKIGNQLYIIGLDNHVGFIYIHENKSYFIHSNYMYPNCVCFEDAINSAALNNNFYYILAPISNNFSLVKRWKTNSFISF